jgi:hypothetical protein
LQEVLADRVAILTYGSKPFEQGLLHVIKRSAHFDAHVDATVQEVIENKLALPNLYAFRPKNIDKKKAKNDAKTQLERDSDPYDSHPAPKDRIAYARALNAPGEKEPDESEAWSIFVSRKKIEKMMTREARAMIERVTGVAIPEKSESEAPAA